MRGVREAEHDGGASLVGDEGAEVAARPVDLAQVLGVDHRSRHRREREALEIGEGERSGPRRAKCEDWRGGDDKEGWMITE